MEHNFDRLIGSYSQNKQGPLLLCIGGIHGNEPAGVNALSLLLKMLEVEPITNPDFQFFGRLIGLRGNIQALQHGQRYIQEDMNRMWTPERLAAIEAKPSGSLQNEELEVYQLRKMVDDIIETYQPERLLVMDLHTTSSSGGIFALVPEDKEIEYIATEMHIPVVKEITKGLRGTTMNYFSDKNFDIPVKEIVFESGQHHEPRSVNRAIAGIVNCMRTIGMVRGEDVENVHDQLLVEHSRRIPMFTRMIHAHALSEGDQFKMNPGYHNFDFIEKDEIVAHDINGPIASPVSGYILMPLYQEQGSDGFFIIDRFPED